MSWPNNIISANYVSKRALETNRNIPSPIGHGWYRKDDQLSAVWMENQPVSESVLELITCTCCKTNCTNSCQRKVLSMGWTDVCKFRGLWGNIIYDSADEDNENDNPDNNV